MPTSDFSKLQPAYGPLRPDAACPRILGIPTLGRRGGIPLVLTLPTPAYSTRRPAAACPRICASRTSGLASLLEPRVCNMLRTRSGSLMTRAARRLRHGPPAPECAQYATCTLQKLNDACTQVMTTWAPRGVHLPSVMFGVPPPRPARHRPPDHVGWAVRPPRAGPSPRACPGAPSGATRPPVQPSPPSRSGGVRAEPISSVTRRRLCRLHRLLGARGADHRHREVERERGRERAMPSHSARILHALFFFRPSQSPDSPLSFTRGETVA